MENFDLNFTVQVDAKGPKKHLGFHVAANDEDEARGILKAELEAVIDQLGGKAPKTAAAPKVAKPAAPKKAAKPATKAKPAK